MSLRQQFLKYNAQTSGAPLLLEFERAEGVYLIDKSGKEHIDLISGIGVSNIGHSHPRIVKAIQQQAENYLHQMVYGEYVQAPQVQYAATLAATLPPTLQSIYFTNSGTEAIEGAMKLAKRVTRRTEIIACYNSYHGSTQGALSLMGNEEYKYAFRPLLPGIKFINFNNKADFDHITRDTAAVFIEPIQGEAGVIAAEEGYLKALKEKCRSTGTLLVFDESQTGFGRSGKLWAFEHSGVIPDILVLAKAIGGGLPLGAFIAAPELMIQLSEDPVLGHISTFGGHPLSCTAGLAAFEVLREEDLITSIPEKYALFRSKLNHPAFQFRGTGLMIALQFDSFEQNKAVIDECIAQGLLVDWFLHNPSALRIAPPLTINANQIAHSSEIILTALAKNGL